MSDNAAMSQAEDPRDAKVERLRAALETLRDWSIRTRDEYQSGERMVHLTRRTGTEFLRATGLLHGPISVLLHVTAACNSALRPDESGKP